MFKNPAYLYKVFNKNKQVAGETVGDQPGGEVDPAGEDQAGPPEGDDGNILTVLSVLAKSVIKICSVLVDPSPMKLLFISHPKHLSQLYF